MAPDLYECIIIGCGPAGLSAAIYLGRGHVKTLVVGSKKKSQLIKAHNIENYFGFPNGIYGKELLDNGSRQVKKFNVEIIDDEVVEAHNEKGCFTLVTAQKKTYNAKTLIIATGTPIRLTGVEKEEELTGRGVHYCVECDGPVYKDKKVAVIGDGNHAAENAIDLLVYTKYVTLISNGEKFNFAPAMQQALGKRFPQLNMKVKAFEGDKFLTDVVLENGRKLPFDAAFMACGDASALDFASEIGLEIKNNVLIVDENNMTSVPGIFAAGNCSGKCRQVAKNVGDGCNAGLGVIKYLRHNQNYTDYSIG